MKRNPADYEHLEVVGPEYFRTLRRLTAFLTELYEETGFHVDAHIYWTLPEVSDLTTFEQHTDQIGHITFSYNQMTATPDEGGYIIDLRDVKE